MGYEYSITYRFTVPYRFRRTRGWGGRRQWHELTRG
jgi:hypothetical protein